ncbi:UPF0598 protein C8orf82-like [Lytechinus variegatus]|uniref:UPF0598 protein C8orf82-like n=1 Tax=Lytechinus variegatus TaxID=7654 RepID=UPI001BB18B07|nr:UPF0598 protein C8orf82-like [Lytechinus variegatus]
MFYLVNISRKFGPLNKIRNCIFFLENPGNFTPKLDVKVSRLGVQSSRNCSTTTPADSAKGTVLNRSPAHYVQGQSPEPKIREYFYFIDHQGQLFLDDARVKNFITCFKDKKFLAFFFKRLKQNSFEHYKDAFPYLSPCGVERNFVRCDDRPIVFTHIIPDPDEPSGPGLLSCNFTGDAVTVKFEPEKVCMLPVSGRIYHPAPHKTGGVGLIKSSIAIDISACFEFGEKGEYSPPTHFTWLGKRYTLTNEVLDLMTDSEKSELEDR